MEISYPMLPTSPSTSARRGAKLFTGIALGLALVAGSAMIADASAFAVQSANADASVRTLAASPTQVETAHQPGAHQPTAASVQVLEPTWSIQVDVAGHQRELDQCLWVRMDFADTAPIVGMHNFCGGDVVLNMVPGQTVQLAGLGLDGTYLVTGDRVAYAGALPSEATAGLYASVLLQTCYWGADAGMRLVALVPLPANPRVVIAAA